MKVAILFFFATIAVVSCFTRSPVLRAAQCKGFCHFRMSLPFYIADTSLAESTYWEGKPPSSVLGVGKSIPSAVFGPLSIVAFILGTYCIHESNIFNQVTVTTINPAYILGSTLVPISWGMHVAAWIQKENGK
eukprot:gene5031-10076_t